jgi:hypothetical protein
MLPTSDFPVAMPPVSPTLSILFSKHSALSQFGRMLSAEC